MQELLDDMSIQPKLKNPVLLRGLYIALLMLAIIATVVAWIEIESILFTGSIGSLLGVVFFVVSKRKEFRDGQFVALSVPVFSGLCFLVIRNMQWGPDAAANPIATAVSCYTIVLCCTFSRLMAQLHPSE